MGKIKALFIAGFGPAGRDVSVSRKLYNQTLGIGFKEEDREVHKAHSRVLARIPGLTTFLRRRPGSSLTWMTLNRQRGSWNLRGIECS